MTSVFFQNVANVKRLALLASGHFQANCEIHVHCKLAPTDFLVHYIDLFERLFAILIDC